MSLIEIFGQMDALGIGMLLGSLLFLGGLVWVLADNKQFEGDVGGTADDVGAAAGAASAGESPLGGDGNLAGPGTGSSPRRPPHSRRAA